MDIANSPGSSAVPSAPRPARPGGTRREWHTRAAMPMVAWMLVAVVLVGVHRFVPRATWLLVHVVTLGIASNAIIVWSNHFADAVLRSAHRGHRREVAELVLLNVGLLALVGGILAQLAPVVWGGATLLVVMALVAIVGLARQARTSLPARFAPTVSWYQAAACFLVVGAVLGALMAVPYGRWSSSLLAAHLACNALGWIGLTVWGTLTSLWPTMLRTRAGEGTDLAARRALPLMATGIVVLADAQLLAPLTPLGWRLAALVGLACYLAGLAHQLGQAVLAWRSARTTSFAVLSAGLAQAWFLVWVLQLAWLQVSSDSAAQLVVRLRPTVPVLVVGFLVQVLAGALSYLVPVVLGGGPAMVRTTTAVFERGAIARLGVVNLGLAVFCLPITSLWKVTSSAAVFAALACFPALLVRAWAVRRSGAVEDTQHRTPASRIPRGLVWALAWTLLCAGVAAAADPTSFRGMLHRPASTNSSTSTTGHTTTVDVEAKGMQFSPSTIHVPAGDRLVVRLTNGDADTVHDLEMATGATSGRLSPGEGASVDVGVVTASQEGWCSVAGHRQMGMVLHVVADGAAGDTTSESPTSTASSSSPTLPSPVSWPSTFTARDATLAPASDQRVHRTTLEVRDSVVEVAPGVKQTLWTFNGTAPGPALRGHVGDVFEITLVNHATMGHSIDFHAGALAPDRPMRTIAPGQSLTYRFTAQRAGIWLYHCSTAPMSLHIANGMYGAVVIDPPDLPRVDREYLLVQGEQYFGAPTADGTPGVADAAKLASGRPDAVVFNGFANQYDHHPLQARTGETVRFWVLDAGPNSSLAFHVVGGQFSSVWSEGAWRLRDGRTPGTTGPSTGGSQSLALLASQGGFVQARFDEAGHYALVNHQMSDAERGAHGVLQVR